MSGFQINRILILRNDSTTAWETSTYILEKGEMGVGYYRAEGNTSIITKIGDGKSTWRELPQTDRVITDNIVITSDFGKYKTTAGRAKIMTNGKLFSEWVLDALTEVKEPELTSPSYTLKKVWFNTDLGENVAGGHIQTLYWEGEYTDAIYPYGYKDNSNETNVHLQPMFTVSFNDEVFSVDGESGWIDLADKEIYLGDTAEVGVYCGWPDGPYALKNNGDVSSYQVVANGISQTFEIQSNKKIVYLLCGESIDSNEIIWDNNHIKIVQKNELCFEIEPKTKRIVVAHFTDEINIKQIINANIGLDMLPLFDKEEVTILDRGGNERKCVALGYETPTPYQNTTSFKIVLQEEE